MAENREKPPLTATFPVYQCRARSDSNRKLPVESVEWRASTDSTKKSYCAPKVGLSDASLTDAAEFLEKIELRARLGL
jgi:hypothetical protein